MEKIQEWTKQSLKRRLNKSLSHDWIPEKSAHKFPLRQYYVQLEWKQKRRTAMGSETRTLTSLHDLVKQMTSATSGTSQEVAANQPQNNAPSVIVEGEKFQDLLRNWLRIRRAWHCKKVMIRLNQNSCSLGCLLTILYPLHCHKKKT